MMARSRSSTPAHDESAPRRAPRGPRRTSALGDKSRASLLPLALESASGRSFHVTPGDGGVVLGANPGCAIVLDDEYCSSRHAMISARAGGWWIEDLDSTNGLFVNGVRVRAAEIRNLDSLVLGRTSLTARVGGGVWPGGSLDGDGGLIHRGQAMDELVARLKRIARGDTPVLLLGESGTGKELLARLVHHASERARGPFVALNCAAFPAELAASTLFGHKKGAFTGALADHKGAFAEADGGSLFLDEVADLRSDHQSMLLRALETGSFRPLGAPNDEHASVRIIAATHRRIDQPGEHFRFDLYQRIAGFIAVVPPLRNRREDIQPIAESLLKRKGRSWKDLTPEARRTLEQYPFPGNVRELIRVIERAVLLSGGGPIRAEDLGIEPSAVLPAAPAQPPSPGRVAVDAQTIQRALDACQGNITHAARSLGVGRSTLLRRMDRLGLRRRR
ncbi:MAG: Anaerobic nitric oxide reductase transcription regulator NorR [Myxococcota bacterium]|nr:Anaerobic nitric oxide reductase transcription regulator NorR [Myxococcota bacterium]